MSKKQKMSLEALRVSSFITHLNQREIVRINGGQEVETASPCKSVDACVELVHDSPRVGTLALSDHRHR